MPESRLEALADVRAKGSIAKLRKIRLRRSLRDNVRKLIEGLGQRKIDAIAKLRSPAYRGIGVAGIRHSTVPGRTPKVGEMQLNVKAHIAPSSFRDSSSLPPGKQAVAASLPDLTLPTASSLLVPAVDGSCSVPNTPLLSKLDSSFSAMSSFL